MEKARIERLYHEHRVHDETRPEATFRPMHRVCVDVREWIANGTSTDIVLHKQVIVDGKKTLDEKIILDISGLEHAKAQREGIRVFDELVAGHPFFGERQDRQ